MPAATMRDAQWAFDAYQNARHRLPTTDFPHASQTVPDLAALSAHFDVFLLDAFGVLNVGETAIPGAPQRIRDLQNAGKTVMVISNAAGYPKRLLLERYARLGYDIAPASILTSREVILAALARRPLAKAGMMASQIFAREELDHLNAEFLGEDATLYDQVDEFLLFGSAEWTDQRQALLIASLRANPRPVLVGNPDIVAPRLDGLSREPGHFAHHLANETGTAPTFFGKPFANIFDMARSRLPANIDPDRVVMVGDTLHTDILGGRVAGFKTALITGFGSLKGMDVPNAIAQSGIVPDFIMPGP
ncbi:MAG: HAD-IIA family hydrolase [Paracoccaceae bacterium]